MLADPADSPPPAVLAKDVEGSVACTGCGAALRPDTGGSIDYRDALCGSYLDSIHRLPARQSG